MSRIEHQGDLYLSTLARYVDAMGGQLEIVATFKGNGVRVPLALGDLTRLTEDDSYRVPGDDVLRDVGVG